MIILSVKLRSCCLQVFSISISPIDLPKLTTFIAGPTSFATVLGLILKNLPSLTTFITKHQAFYVTKLLSFKNLPKLTTIGIGPSCFVGAQNLVLEDLPSLTQFNVVAPSFKMVSSVTLTNVAFTEGTFTRIVIPGVEVPFQALTQESFKCDETSISLRDRILSQD